MVLIPVPAVWLQYWPRCWCTTFSGLVHCGSPHRPFGLGAHSGFLQVPCCLFCGGGLYGSCFAAVGLMAVVSYTLRRWTFLVLLLSQRWFCCSSSSSSNTASKGSLSCFRAAVGSATIGSRWTVTVQGCLLGRRLLALLLLPLFGVIIKTNNE